MCFCLKVGFVGDRFYQQNQADCFLFPLWKFCCVKGCLRANAKWGISSQEGFIIIHSS